MRVHLLHDGGGLDEKARSDLTRMLEYARPAKICFCTSRAESERALQSIEEAMRDLAPQVQQVCAIGAQQLVPLIQRHQESFRKRYAAELMDHADFLSRTSNDLSGNEVLGM